MATNLQFIKSNTASSVTSMDITDCFTDQYDVYAIMIDNYDIGSGVDLTPITQPDLHWNFSGTMSLAGYLVQLDTQSDFSSVNAVTYASWNDAGFDSTNLTFAPSSDLDTGETWYWRVRAVSATNQIGNWSETFHFLLPDITTWSIDSNTSAVELHHREAMPSLNIPDFIDPWIADSGIGNTSSQFSSTSIRVGTSTS